MLLDNFPPMTGAASPNRVGVVDGGKDQHGRAARGGVGGDGALPVGETGGEGADARRAVRALRQHETVGPGGDEAPRSQNCTPNNTPPPPLPAPRPPCRLWQFLVP